MLELHNMSILCLCCASVHYENLECALVVTPIACASGSVVVIVVRVVKKLLANLYMRYVIASKDLHCNSSFCVL